MTASERLAALQSNSYPCLQKKDSAKLIECNRRREEMIETAKILVKQEELISDIEEFETGLNNVSEVATLLKNLKIIDGEALAFISKTVSLGKTIMGGVKSYLSSGNLFMPAVTTLNGIFSIFGGAPSAVEQKLDQLIAKERLSKN